MFGRRIAMVALAPALVVACGEAGGDREPAQFDGTGPTWTSELQYEIGEAVEGDALFHIIRTVRVDRGGQRVFVVDPGLSRVSVWTPDGQLLFAVGQAGEGPGDLASPRSVYPHDSGFLVRERRRLSHFSKPARQRFLRLRRPATRSGSGDCGSIRSRSRAPFSTK